MSKSKEPNIWTKKIKDLEDNVKGETQSQFKNLSKKDAIVYCKLKEREMRKGVKEYFLSWENKTGIAIITHIESNRQFKLK